jgi:hypothetical protein
MPATQTNFYATYSDVEEVLALFETKERVTYVLTGLFDTNVPQTFETFRAINSLSVSTAGDANDVASYLIVTHRNKVATREVPQRIGGTKFAVDQNSNPDSLYFRSGGTFSNKIIVPGTIGIIHQTSVSKKLYGALLRIIVKNFSRVRSYYVGPEALTLWKGGMRLGLSLKASPQIDLRE